MIQNHIHVHQKIAPLVKKKEKITTLQIECDERITMECKNVNDS